MPPAAAGPSEPRDSCAKGIIIWHFPSALAGGPPCYEAVPKLQFCKATPSYWVVELAPTSSLACAIKEVVAWPVPFMALACRSAGPTRQGPSGREDCHIIRYVRSKLLKPVLLTFPPAPSPRVWRRKGRRLNRGRRLPTPGVTGTVTAASPSPVGPFARIVAIGQCSGASVPNLREGEAAHITTSTSLGMNRG